MGAAEGICKRSGKVKMGRLTADAVLIHITKEGAGWTPGAYRCRHCGSWHITSRPQSNRPKLKPRRR